MKSRIKNLLKKIVKGYLRDIYWDIYGKTIRNPECIREPESFVFVCKGNICRSPFAHYMAQKIISNGVKCNIKFDSAGLEVKEPKSSPENAVLAALDYGLDLKSHRSRILVRKMFESSDMIIAMETWHFQTLKRIFPENMDKIFLLPLFENNKYAKIKGFYRYNIRDPYGKSLNEFHVCFRRIERCIKALFKKL